MDFNRGMGSMNDKDGRPLARQGSVYNLTFEEFQNSMGGLGKDFGSMNMDELLKNIWTAEESQAMASALAGEAKLIPPGGGIQRQGSLALPRTLSQKTVDEVWRDLVRENTPSTSFQVLPPGNPPPQPPSQPGRQQTLGEMTLEEFLVRAGVDINNSINIANPPNHNNINNSNNAINNNNTNHASSSNTNNLFFGGNFNSNGNVAVMPMPLQSFGDQVVSIATNGGMPGVVGMGPVMGGSPGKGNGDMSSLSPVSYPFGGGMRVKKSGPVEKVVERRQRRMIKNRESAARSRARKQAYTIELEAEVAKLKEQNEELQKKQTEIMEMQKNQSPEVLDQQSGPKKRCLRRTQTGPW